MLAFRLAHSLDAHGQHFTALVLEMFMILFAVFRGLDFHAQKLAIRMKGFWSNFRVLHVHNVSCD